MISFASFQPRVYTWLVKCFGKETADKHDERRQRFCEEALELVQAAGGSREMAHAMVDYVFDRPIGELEQEIGGAQTTMAALAQAFNIDMDVAREKELARAESKTEEIRVKWATKPKLGDNKDSIS